jgi:hypothetical protein
MKKYIDLWMALKKKWKMASIVLVLIIVLQIINLF